MKKKKSWFVIIVLLIICLLVYYFFPKPACSLSSLDKRAVWFSYTDLSKFSYESKKQFREDFSLAIDNVKKYKTNI